MNTTDIIKTIMSLQYLGIQVEDVQQDNWDFTQPIVYRFSVPEKSEIRFESIDDYDTQTAEGLIQITKETLIDIICESSEEDDSDLSRELRKYITDHAKFYAKVRKGEVWTKELGLKELEKINNQAEEYKEV